MAWNPYTLQGCNHTESQLLNKELKENSQYKCKLTLKNKRLADLKRKPNKRGLQ